MNINAVKWLKRYPLTFLLTAAIWYLSLFTPPRTPLDDVQFIDKWTHLVMYGSLTLALWWEDGRARKRLAAWTRAAWIFLCPAAMGGIVELAQAYCTTNRTGDLLDFAANAAGSLIGIGIGHCADRIRKGRRHSC